ncbi:MAG: LuxR family transcriptional regulator, partial [Ktedonobacterales bacterium]|nr:LuxR family transcriptional regulator [Ktedonobacterales bacterium]
MPRQAAYLVRWDASVAAYLASDATHPLMGDLWGTWVARHHAFAFQGQGGHINLLKERRHGGEAGYWYAYRRTGKRVTKRYAGRPEQLTLARLEALACALNALSPAMAEDEAAQLPIVISPVPVSLPLLAAKLQAPRLRKGLVPRERLLQRLDAGREGALMLITAPAGFGKTTLVNQWLASRVASGAIPAFAWLALDAGDSDPARFWRYFIAACQRIAPTIGRDALALLHAATLPPFVAPTPEALLTMLLNDLVHAGCQGVLVLEDYHLIT